MDSPFANRLFRITFVAAGIYNLAFGLWAVLWPMAFFDMFAIERPRYPGIWACLGMVVGVYGLLYLLAAWRLETAWPAIAVGLLGKVLGPIGMVMSFSDDWPQRLGCSVFGTISSGGCRLGCFCCAAQRLGGRSFP